MYAGKRPAYAAVSGKKKQAKQAGSAFGGAGNSAHDQHGAACFLTKPAAAAVVSAPLVLVFSFMALSAFWRQAPEISETAKRFVEVRQGVPGLPLSPPVLPTKVASNKQYHVNEAVYASKVAWLMETSRANVTGEAISEVRLNQLYKQGRRSYFRHAADLEVRAKNRTGCLRADRVCIASMTACPSTLRR